MDLASNSCPSLSVLPHPNSQWFLLTSVFPPKTCIFTFQDILEGNLMGQLSKLLDNWGFLANQDDPFLGVHSGSPFVSSCLKDVTARAGL